MSDAEKGGRKPQGGVPGHCQRFVIRHVKGVTTKKWSQLKIFVNSTLKIGINMSKLLAAVIAAMFALGTTSIFAADDMKKDAKKDEPKKEAKKDDTKKDEMKKDKK
jgi:hypothetical protein